MSVVGFLICEEHKFGEGMVCEVFVTSEKRSHIEAIIIRAPVAAAQLLLIHLAAILTEDKS